MAWPMLSPFLSPASSAQLLHGPFQVSPAVPSSARAWPSPDTIQPGLCLTQPGPCLTQPGTGQACSAWPPARGTAVTTGLTAPVHVASGTSGTEDNIERP